MLVEVSIPFDFLAIRALRTLWQYEGIKEVSIADLKKYQIFKLTIAKEILQEDNVNVNFIADDNNNFSTFLDMYKNIFAIKDNSIYICNDNLKFNDLQKLEEQVFINYKNNIELNSRVKLLHLRHAFSNCVYKYDLELSILNIHSISDFILNYCNFEKTVLNSYLKKSHPKILKSYLFTRFIFIYNFINYSFMQKENIRDILLTHSDLLNYDILPTIEEEMEYFTNNYSLSTQNDYYINFDEFFFNMYNAAIFGCNNLEVLKVMTMLNNESEHDFKVLNNIDIEDYNYDDTYNEVFDNELDEDNILEEFYYYNAPSYVFYMHYIDKINEFLNNFYLDQELENIKNKLLYVLDMPNFELYSIDNYNDLEETFKEYTIDKDDFLGEKIMVIYFINELFNIKEDIFTLRKVLFIATYYDLTKDEEVIKELAKYKDNKLYNKYIDIIIDTKDDTRKLSK